MAFAACDGDSPDTTLQVSRRSCSPEDNGCVDCSSAEHGASRGVFVKFPCEEVVGGRTVMVIGTVDMLGAEMLESVTVIVSEIIDPAGELAGIVKE